MDRAGDRTPSPGANVFSVVLGVASSVDDGRLWLSEKICDLSPCRDLRIIRRAVPLARGGLRELGRQRPSVGGPRADASVEQTRVRMPKIAEEPPRARGPKARVGLIDHDSAIRSDAAKRK